MTGSTMTASIPIRSLGLYIRRQFGLFPSPAVWPLENAPNVDRYPAAAWGRKRRETCSCFEHWLPLRRAGADPACLACRSSGTVSTGLAKGTLHPTKRIEIGLVGSVGLRQSPAMFPG